jgi:multidrug efflux pump subunit AcrA (membrane-fusion protein)
MVPKSAVLHIRNGNYIIVDRGAGSYQRVVIKSAPFDENQTAVLSGLTGSEKVVVEGATLINEMMGEI